MHTRVWFVGWPPHNLSTSEVNQLGFGCPPNEKVVQFHITLEHSTEAHMHSMCTACTILSRSLLIKDIMLHKSQNKLSQLWPTSAPNIKVFAVKMHLYHLWAALNSLCKDLCHLCHVNLVKRDSNVLYHKDEDKGKHFPSRSGLIYFYSL